LLAALDDLRWTHDDSVRLHAERIDRQTDGHQTVAILLPLCGRVERVIILRDRLHQITNLTSSNLISTDLISSQLSDSVCRGCDQSERTGLLNLSSPHHRVLTRFTVGFYVHGLSDLSPFYWSQPR